MPTAGAVRAALHDHIGACCACQSCAQLLKGSAQLELNAARQNLAACEDEADEQRAVLAYRIVSSQPFYSALG